MTDVIRMDRSRYLIVGNDRIQAESRQIEGGTALRWTISDTALADLFHDLNRLTVPETTADLAMDAIVDAIEAECGSAKVFIMTVDERLQEQGWASDGHYAAERMARKCAGEGDCEVIWQQRLLCCPVPRRIVDAVETTMRKLIGDEVVMKRTLRGEPGWTLSRDGRSFKISVAEAVHLPVIVLEKAIWDELAKLDGETAA